MTLDELQRIKQWHVAHRREHPLEYHLWYAILTLWLVGWVGWFPAYALEQFWSIPLCVLGTATPSIYVQADAVLGPRAQLVMPLNPAYGLILNFRQAMLGGAPDWYALAVSGAVSLALLAIGCAYFHRVERDFADII